MPKPKLKLDPTFNMSSMTDIVFLLLIFFMLTSNFVTPSAVKVEVPSSKSGGTVLPSVSVTIAEDGKFYINKQEVALENLKDELKVILAGGSSVQNVMLYTDQKVPVQKVIQVMDVGTELGININVAVKNQGK